MQKQQKYLIVIVIILGIIILLLSGLIYWQSKSSQPEQNQTAQTNTSLGDLEEDNDSDNEPNDDSQPIDKVAAIQQENIESVETESDLGEYNLNPAKTTKDYLANENISPIYNRKGTVTDINLDNNTLAFDSEMNGKAKNYTVTVTNDTYIELSEVNAVYDSLENYELINKKVSGGEVQLNKLKKGDMVFIKSKNAFGADVVIAEKIDVSRYTETFQNSNN